MRFRQMSVRDAPVVALLHVHGIRTGFISSLGADVVTFLYEAVAQHKDSFALVAEERDKVIGFAAFSADINGLYKSVLWQKGYHLAILLAGRLFSLKRVKKMLETLFYPRRTQKRNLPSAELLSVVVAPEYRGKGLATRLLKRGLEQCQEKRIDKIKVLVAGDNEPATRLYIKCGFELAGQMNSHGVVSNVYVARTG